MLLGIDVGGTFTDAVVLDGKFVVAKAKAPTTHGDLLTGILAALDRALAGIDQSSIRRVALSTTIVTNALIEGRTDKVGLCLMPGPGADIAPLVPDESCLLSGYIDHRGREVQPPLQAEVDAACEVFKDCRVYAVVGKFAVRNPRHELAVAGWIKQKARPGNITLSSGVAGGLNFWRRTNSAFYNAAVWRQFNKFTAAIKAAVQQRGITAPVYILKADGGTMPLETAGLLPVETIFTGPAASVLGIMAMAPVDRPAVSLDIGGTTTDIALWQQGLPLYAGRGAVINGYPTAVRAFRLKSVGIGGDSFVRREDGRILVGPMRKGPAMALGGSEPAVSDAMIVAGLAGFGDRKRALDAMRKVAKGEQDPVSVAREVLNEAAVIIQRAVREMIEEQAAEPVYRVEDIIHGKRFSPELIVGVGGAAAGLVPLVAEMLHVQGMIPDGAMVANAVGAAVARPTIDITLRADTEQGLYTVAELGIQDKIPGRRFTLADGSELAARYLRERARQSGIALTETEMMQQEEFNLVRGFRSTGKIMTCRMQIKPGVLTEVAPFSAKEGVS